MSIAMGFLESSLWQAPVVYWGVQLAETSSLLGKDDKKFEKAGECGILFTSCETYCEPSQCTDAVPIIGRHVCCKACDPPKQACVLTGPSRCFSSNVSSESLKSNAASAGSSEKSRCTFRFSVCEQKNLTSWVLVGSCSKLSHIVHACALS